LSLLVVPVIYELVDATIERMTPRRKKHEANAIATGTVSRVL
jgi:hypothetical protein